MAVYDDLNNKQIFNASVISIAVTAVTVLAVQVLYFAMADYVDQQKIDAAKYTRQNKRLAAQAEELDRFGVDEETGNIVIPVSKVMAEMAAEASKNGNEQT